MLTILPATGLAEPDRPTVLEPLEVRVIADRARDFTEPSGLARGPDGATLWAVSDDAGALFRLDSRGEVVERVDLGKHTHGLEGLAWDAGGARFLMVREESAEILALDPAAPDSLARFPLDRMQGYAAVAPLFAGDARNGLEGITVVPETGTVILVKENDPRLLLELTGDLTAIRGALLLSAGIGFTDPDVPDRDLDISGIAYDPARGLLWIVSDTGRKVFLLDPQTRGVTGLPLTWTDAGTVRRLDNAEGVALTPDGQRLAVVTDDGKGSRLVVYAIK